MNNTKEQTNCICGCHQITPTRHQITFITCALIQSMQTEIAVAFDVRANNRRRTVISDSRDSVRITHNTEAGREINYTTLTGLFVAATNRMRQAASHDIIAQRTNKGRPRQQDSLNSVSVPPFVSGQIRKNISLLFVINSGTHKTQSDDASSRLHSHLSCLFLSSYPFVVASVLFLGELGQSVSVSPLKDSTIFFSRTRRARPDVRSTLVQDL